MFIWARRGPSRRGGIKEKQKLKAQTLKCVGCQKIYEDEPNDMLSQLFVYLPKGCDEVRILGKQ